MGNTCQAYGLNVSKDIRRLWRFKPLKMEEELRRGQLSERFFKWRGNRCLSKKLKKRPPIHRRP
ncbi:hypothetical protein [Bacillus sonorensis]|uniref:hypothetical protein n=1 Tax=Bacillus sonorensis TaxID=119858 RepID=UPI0022824BA9|nr:hypothetical protein [Bacillus sonorensis]MCY8604651.1 hypothetical protein [Bacillus sonorensis]